MRPNALKPDAVKPEMETPDDRRRILIEQLSDRYSAGGIRKRRLNRFVGGVFWLVWVQVLSGIRRVLDLLVSAGLLLILSPAFLILYIVARSRNGTLSRSPRLGRWGTVYNELAFTRVPFARLPALLNILKGDMSLIGPRPVSPGDVTPADRAAWRRFNIRPGLLCLWWIRQRTNIAYGSEFDVDSEYLDTHSLLGDLAIGLRAIPAAFYGQGVAMAPDKIDFLGIAIDNLTMDEAITRIAEIAGRSDPPRQACFVNADCVNISYRDADYAEVLRGASLVFADGIGVKLAGRILNSNIRQNVNGTDLFPLLCAEMEKRSGSFYLLGGKPGVSGDVVRWMSNHCPALQVRGHHHGFFTPGETPAILSEMRESGADILLVAFGAPRQDKWIRDHLQETGVKLAIGVGGLFDFYSGRIPRAPVWVREIGMEWFYRFVQEPRRMWRRYFVGNAVFLWRVVWNRLAGSEPARRTTV